MSREGVSDFLSQVENTCSTAGRPGSGRPSKQMEQVKEVVESAMHADDKTTVKPLHEKLISRRASVSKNTVLRCSQSLGWTVRGSAYC